MANRDISEQRKALYYLGMILIVIGLLTFVSVFVTGLMNFGDFSDFHGQAKSSGIRALLGMAMIFIGGILRVVGAAGLAGSGVVLDPQQARKDVEPWSRMAGGVVKDVIDETGIEIGGGSNDESTPQPDFDEKLRKLHKLYQDGLLTKEEYEKEKAETLEEI